MHIEARALRVERGGRNILNNLSFSLNSGEALIVTGTNGAGKSTLLRTLAGLLPLAAGEIIVKPGREAGRATLCHYIGHADALKAGLTVAENLAFWSNMLAPGTPEPDLGFSGRAAASVDAALARLGLGHAADLPAAYLSAGQRRRAAIARLLTVPRPLWLLDEPLTALDTSAQGLLTGLLQAHLADGGLIIAATHAPLTIAAHRLELGLELGGRP
jgi:heme exporter protein A